MVQYFIKGNGVSVEGFEDIADGSLFAEFHIVNDEIWSAIKDGTYRGFSLEGVFDLVPERDKTKVEEIVDTLDGAFSRILNKSKKYTMGNLKRFKAALLKALAEFANVSTDKGILAWDGDEDLKVGDAVYIEDAEGNRTPAEDGDYKTDDNKTIVVVDGKVAEINDPEVDIEPTEEAEPIAEEEVADETTEEPTEEVAEEGGLTPNATDKGDLYCEGELAVDKEVFVLDAEGNVVPAEDGDYTLENGNVVKVAEGKVAEIAETADSADIEEETPAEDEALVALKAENESLKAEIEELKKQMETLKAQPMAKSAHEEVVTTQTISKTGDKGLDKLAKLMSR